MLKIKTSWLTKPANFPTGHAKDASQNPSCCTCIAALRGSMWAWLRTSHFPDTQIQMAHPLISATLSVSTPQTKYLGFVVHESWKLKCICYWTTSQQSPCSQTETSKTGCRSSRKTSLSHTLPWLNLLKLKKKSLP